MQTTTLSFANIHNHGELFANLLRARRQSFIVQNRWDLPQAMGMEFDQYDTPASRWVAVHHPFTRPLPEDDTVFGTVFLLLALFGAPLFAVIGAGALWGFYQSEIDLSVVAIEFFRIAEMPVTRGMYTSISGAIEFALPLFEGNGYQGMRRVIDISGDGDDNAGTVPEAERLLAERDNVTINALAIESLGLSITNYYRQKVITRNGFVMTARGHSTYAETLKEKIRREVAQVMF